MRFSILIFLFFYFQTFSQSTVPVIVYLTDKNCSEYSIQKPANYLSNRAIQRRISQGIPIAHSDLPICSEYEKGIVEACEGRVRQRSKWMNSILVYVDNPTLLPKIEQLNYVSKIQVLSMPGVSTLKHDKLEKEFLTREEFNYGDTEEQIKMHNLHLLHQLGYTGSGIQVAVFDAGFSGVDTLNAFAYMNDNGNLLGIKDFVNATDTDFYDHSHGRSVLSTMAGYLPGAYIGASPDASYYLFRTEDASSETLVEEYNWLAAAEYADSLGVDIINSSLGYTTFDDSLENHTYEQLDGNTTIITRAADWAASKGIIVVNSAGNSGNNSWHYLSAPSDADSALCVAAVGSDSAKASFSSFGPRVDGVVKPDVAARGLLAKVIASNGWGTNSNGTSFSSPIIAGSVACLWQAFPNESNMDIIDIIKEHGHQSESPDSLLGYGIPDLYAAYLTLKNQNMNILTDFVEVFPNPITNDFVIEYFATTTQTVSLNIYAVTGALCHYDELEVEKGRNRINKQIDWDAFVDGVYIMQFNDGEHLLSKRVIKF